jgi:hypothetical protein
MKGEANKLNGGAVNARQEQSEFDPEALLTEYIDSLNDYRDGYVVKPNAFFTEEAYLIKKKFQDAQKKNPSLAPENFLYNHELKIYKATEKNKLRRSWSNVLVELRHVFSTLKQQEIIVGAPDWEKDLQALLKKYKEHSRKYWYLQDVFHQFGLAKDKMELPFAIVRDGKVIEGYKVLKAVKFKTNKEYEDYLKKQMPQDYLDNVYFTDKEGNLLDFKEKKDQHDKYKKHNYDEYINERVELIKEIDELIFFVVNSVLIPQREKFIKEKLNSLKAKLTLKKI